MSVSRLELMKRMFAVSFVFPMQGGRAFVRVTRRSNEMIFEVALTEISLLLWKDREEIVDEF